MSDAHGVARDQLRAFIERIERLSEEKKTIEDDIKDVFGEAKSFGYCVKTMKKVIALRKKDEQERTEEEMVLDTYLAALGMIPQFEMFEPAEVKPVSREERRRQFMTDDMADHKTLIDEMADAGMISEQARHENKALADAVATKFGNGPAQALQSPRKAAEAVSERTATESVAKASGEQTEGTTGLQAAGPRREMRVGEAPALVPATSDDGRDSVERHAPISPETADKTVGGFPVAAAPTNAEETGVKGRDVQDAHENVVVKSVTVVGTESGTVANSESAPASQGEAEAPSVESVTPHRLGSLDANTGGTHEEVGDLSAAQAETIVIPSVSAAPGNVTVEKDPPFGMKRSSFGHCFPELSSSDYSKLRTSIITHGVEEPIIRKGDVILDGWSRYNIARSLRLEYPVKEYDGSDELLDVIRWQMASRDWTTAEKRKIASALSKEIPHRAGDIMRVLHLESEAA